MRRKGVFIIIEGTDGSGKAEQTKKLIERLQRVGVEVKMFDFPQYGQPSAYFVERYLNGDYGSLDFVGPRKASVFYAVDRFEVGLKIHEWLDRGEVVVSNRFVVSNMAHQGSKISDTEQRRKFFSWVDEFEHGILEIPRPTLTLVLHMPAEIAQTLVDKKEERKYLRGKRRDIHEEDIDHLRRTEKVYLELVEMFPKEFCLVECVESGRLLSIGEIHEKVWSIVDPLF